MAQHTQVGGIVICYTSRTSNDAQKLSNHPIRGTKSSLTDVKSWSLRPALFRPSAVSNGSRRLSEPVDLDIAVN